MFKSVVIKLITGYQKVIHKVRPQSPCRFYPTCSQYTKEAIIEYGILKGVFLGTKRIAKCNPLFPGGKDPVTRK